MLLLAIGPAMALVDTSQEAGISIVEPGAAASWWWAAPVWTLQIAPLLWRRRRPVAVLAVVTAVLLIGQFLVPTRSLADLGPMLAAYSVAAWSAPRVAAVVISASFGAWTVVLWYAGLPLSPGASIAALMVLAPAVPGWLARRRNLATRRADGSGPARSRADHAIAAATSGSADAIGPLVTPREAEVLELVARGPRRERAGAARGSAQR